MRKTALLLLAAALLSACGTTGDLYSWGGYRNKTSAYEDYAYQYYHRQTPESLCDLLACYEQMVSTPGGSRQVPPPGICAEYGYLLLLPETAVTFMNHASASQKRLFQTGDFAGLFQERGKEMLQMEIELYPESAIFIRPLIKKLVK